VAAGDYAQPVPVATADELGELAASFNTMQHGLRERASLHAAFGTFVDPSLTTRLLELGDDAFTGDVVEVTVLFVDVRGFTTYAATVDPTDAVALLNRLFAVVVPVVREHSGHPNHFLGDGLLAIFGAPDPVHNHADRAVAAAIEIQHAVHAEFGDGLRVGIGLNTGKVIAGTIGGGGKLEYTVIGDAVNVASRVEQLTKVTGDAILVTEATAGALTSCTGLIDRGRHEVRGKEQPINVLAVPC
jgi:class 3 adenylate cyclase